MLLLLWRGATGVVLGRKSKHILPNKIVRRFFFLAFRGLCPNLYLSRPLTIVMALNLALGAWCGYTRITSQ